MKDFLQAFSSLSKAHSSMVYLMWIYFVGVIVSTTFVNIYVFQLASSYTHVLIFNLITFTSSAIWFVSVGILYSLLQRNVSEMYYIGYVFFMLSFVVLFLFPYNLYASYIYGVFYGVAAGTYWNAVHSQELKNIGDTSRDFYSSSISAGSNLISVFVPLLISWLFILWDSISFDAYTALFLFLPCLYWVSFLFIKNIPEYIPKKINISDIFECFHLKYKYWNAYLLSSWAKHWLVKTSVAIASIMLLKSEINIGLLQWFLAFISSYVVIYFWLKRNIWNRLRYFFYICIFLSSLYFLLAASFNIYTFLLFSFWILFLFPMYRVSAHTYDLAVMDNNKSTKDQDFYPKMLWREILLIISRGWSILSMLLILYLTDISSEWALRISFMLIWLCILWEVFWIRLWEKYEK